MADMERLYEVMRKLLDVTDSSFVRYRFNEIPWKSRMLGLVGPRGVGKTTLFLQRIKLNHSVKDTLYASADNLYFADNKLIDLADEFYRNGGKYLFIDEVHKYSGWSQELKQIYDSYPKLHIYFTGSSVLDITKGESDLSRRAPVYLMQGLSFREFLKIRHNIDMPVYTIKQLIDHKVDTDILDHPLPLFKEYLLNGYYPFGKDADFPLELQQVINRTMENDIPLYANMNVSTGQKLKKLLVIISESVPFKPNVSTLAQTIGVSRNNVADYLLYMEHAGMLAQLRDSAGGIRGLGKVEKIYIDNPNLISVLADRNSNIGNIRETFFYNQTRVVADTISSYDSDFKIGDATFEIGGKNKGGKQIKGIKNSYIVRDDIEYGHGNVIPLWQFGLLY